MQLVDSWHFLQGMPFKYDMRQNEDVPELKAAAEQKYGLRTGQFPTPPQAAPEEQQDTLRQLPMQTLAMPEGPHGGARATQAGPQPGGT